MKTDQIFSDLIKTIMTTGEEVSTRNSITMRAESLSMCFDETALVNVRTTAWKLALREFEWFMSGSSNINDLHTSVRHWWEPWADANGNIANNYSKQFRAFENNKTSVDQVQYMIDTLTRHPYSRRNVITTWNTADMIASETPITNCHGSLISATVSPSTNKVSLHMVQRSADVVLGLPHNMIQYWAFLMYIAHRSGREVGKLHWTGFDCHIYQDHYDMANKIIATDLSTLSTPNLVYASTSEDFKADDFTLDSEYKPLYKEKLKMTV